MNAVAPIKVFVVDDHPAVREALKLWVSRRDDLNFCGEAANGEETLRLLTTVRPDIIIVDLLLKNENGLDLIKRIRTHDPRVKILVCSTLDDIDYAERALRAGALGYINKDQAADRLIAAIYRVMEGKHYLAEPIAERVLDRALKKGDEQFATSPMARLSDRELETLQWLGRGHSTREIAECMHVSPKTVETYRARIKEKLELSSHNELLRRAVEWVLQKS